MSTVDHRIMLGLSGVVTLVPMPFRATADGNVSRSGRTFFNLHWRPNSVQALAFLYFDYSEGDCLDAAAKLGVTCS
jgi:hypothetical protein